MDLQQQTLCKPEHKLFSLAQWLGHQPLTQKILLVFPCLRVLGLPRNTLKGCCENEHDGDSQAVTPGDNGRLSAMKLEMGHIQNERGRKPSPQQRGDGPRKADHSCTMGGRFGLRMMV